MTFSTSTRSRGDNAGTFRVLSKFRSAVHPYPYHLNLLPMLRPTQEIIFFIEPHRGRGRSNYLIKANEFSSLNFSPVIYLRWHFRKSIFLICTTIRVPIINVLLDFHFSFSLLPLLIRLIETQIRMLISRPYQIRSANKVFWRRKKKNREAYCWRSSVRSGSWNNVFAETRTFPGCAPWRLNFFDSRLAESS